MSSRFLSSFSYQHAVIFHAVVVGLITLSLPLFDSPSATLMFGGILCTFTYLALGIHEVWHFPLWFSPLSFYFLWNVVALGFSAIHMAGEAVPGAWIPFLNATVSPEDLALGYVIYLVGSWALHAGLQARRPRQLPQGSLPQPEFRTNLLGWCIVLWGLGLLSLWNVSLVAFLGAISGYLQWAPVAALSLFVLAPRQHLRLSKMAFAGSLLLGLGGLLSVALVSYSKTFIMFSFFPLLWLFLTKPSLRRWFPLLALGLFAFQLTITPVIMFARIFPRQDNENRWAHIFSAFLSGKALSAEIIDSNFYNEQGKQFLERLFEPIPVGYLVNEVRREGFQLGATMAYASYSFIPRVLWPDKPYVNRGAWFTSYMGFARSEEEATTATAITAAGELYWNFGFPGVLMGMFILGIFLGQLWRLASFEPHKEPLHMLLYVILIINMMNMAEFVSVAVYFVSAFLTFKLAFMILATLRHTVHGSQGALSV